MDTRVSASFRRDWRGMEGWFTDELVVENWTTIEEFHQSSLVEVLSADYWTA
jgi:hypothetical protein